MSEMLAVALGASATRCGSNRYQPGGSPATFSSTSRLRPLPFRRARPTRSCPPGAARNRLRSIVSCRPPSPPAGIEGTDPAGGVAGGVGSGASGCPGRWIVMAITTSACPAAPAWSTARTPIRWVAGGVPAGGRSTRLAVALSPGKTPTCAGSQAAQRAAGPEGRSSNWPAASPRFCSVSVMRPSSPPARVIVEGSAVSETGTTPPRQCRRIPVSAIAASTTGDRAITRLPRAEAEAPGQGTDLPGRQPVGFRLCHMQTAGIHAGSPAVHQTRPGHAAPDCRIEPDQAVQNVLVGLPAANHDLTRGTVCREHIGLYCRRRAASERRWLEPAARTAVRLPRDRARKGQAARRRQAAMSCEKASCPVYAPAARFQHATSHSGCQ